MLAVSVMLYALAVYLRRVMHIRDRRAVSYHDPVGPTLVCCGLFVLLSGCVITAWLG